MVFGLDQATKVGMRIAFRVDPVSWTPTCRRARQGSRGVERVSKRICGLR